MVYLREGLQIKISQWKKYKGQNVHCFLLWSQVIYLPDINMWCIHDTLPTNKLTRVSVFGVFTGVPLLQEWFIWPCGWLSPVPLVKLITQNPKTPTLHDMAGPFKSGQPLPWILSGVAYFHPNSHRCTICHDLRPLANKDTPRRLRDELPGQGKAQASFWVG